MTTKIFIFCFFVVCFWRSVSSYSCPSVNVTHGKVKYSRGERIVRFSCDRSFILVGPSSAICSHGEWSYPPPVCARTNCPSLGRLLHGNIEFGYRGAVATLTCDPGFNLTGSPSLLCTEYGWNDTVPDCQANSHLQFSMCHFEPEEIIQCNWIPKPALFKWIIKSSTIHKSTDIGKYPGFDHTLGPHTGGHYLFLDNTMPVSVNSLRFQRRLDNGAQYISPLFPAINSTEESCLLFFIYSYGPNAGSVKVTINNDTVWENDELLRRNMWMKVTINLVHQRSPFRIIIIGKGHIGESSNTAIDDLRIASGSDCTDTVDSVLPYSVEPVLPSDDEDETSPPLKTIFKRETTTEMNKHTSLTQSVTDDFSLPMVPNHHQDSQTTDKSTPVISLHSSVLPTNTTFIHSFLNLTQIPNAELTNKQSSFLHTNRMEIHLFSSSTDTPTKIQSSPVWHPTNPVEIHSLNFSTDTPTKIQSSPAFHPTNPVEIHSLNFSVNTPTKIQSSPVLHPTNPVEIHSLNFSADTPTKIQSSPVLHPTNPVEIHSLNFSTDTPTKIQSSPVLHTNPVEIHSSQNPTETTPNVTLTSLVHLSETVTDIQLTNISSSEGFERHHSDSHFPSDVESNEKNYANATATPQKTPKNSVRFTDFEKSMIYALVVVCSVAIFIAAVFIKRYCYYQTLVINNKETTLDLEFVKFLNDVELIDK